MGQLYTLEVERPNLTLNLLIVLKSCFGTTGLVGVCRCQLEVTFHVN